MKSVFIGSNGSMGLTKGKEYDIRVVNPRGEFRSYNLVIEISRDGYKIFCPYDTLEGFIKNWNIHSDNKINF